MIGCYFVDNGRIKVYPRELIFYIAVKILNKQKPEKTRLEAHVLFHLRKSGVWMEKSERNVFDWLYLGTNRPEFNKFCSDGHKIFLYFH